MARVCGTLYLNASLCPIGSWCLYNWNIVRERKRVRRPKSEDICICTFSILEAREEERERKRERSESGGKRASVRKERARTWQTKERGGAREIIREHHAYIHKYLDTINVYMYIAAQSRG